MTRAVSVLKRATKASNDPSWTLVLPPFRQFQSQDFERWDAFFDISKAKQLAADRAFNDVIELADLFAYKAARVAGKPKIDLVVLPLSLNQDLQKKANDFG